jgi:N-acetylglucosaminyldiphosphoundecaprenol N-acetyl-beta-D-mannosaminyltransferase
MLCGVVMRASFPGCPIDVLTMADTVELALRAMLSHQRLQHVALNVAQFVNMRFDPVLAADVAKLVPRHRGFDSLASG